MINYKESEDIMKPKYKVIRWFDDGTEEIWEAPQKPTFPQMYKLINCTTIERQSGYDKEISNRTFDMWCDEESKMKGDAFKKAEAQLERVRQDAKTFFVKKAKTESKKEKLAYNFTEKDETISLKDCEEQLRDWAKELVDREIRRRPEGLQLKQLEDVKTKAIDTVMESGSSDELIKALDLCTKKIGITWIVDTSKIKQLEAR